MEGNGKEGKVLYNGEKLKSLDEILPEMAIAQYGKLYFMQFYNCFYTGSLVISDVLLTRSV